MGWQISTFEDRTPVAGLPAPVAALIQSHDLTTSSGDKVSFCGVLIAKNSLNLFVPRNSARSVNGEDQQYLTPLMMHALRKYHHRFKSGLTNNDNGIGFVGTEKLSLVYQLLEDYQKFGIYRRRSTIKVVNTGKPDWSKTISKFVPVSSAGNIVYTDYIGSKHKYSADFEIAKIHAFLIKRLDTRYALMFKGKSIFTDHSLPKPSSIKTSYMLAKLETELKSVYSNRDIWLIKNLITLLKQEYGQLETTTVIGIKYFHVMWEHMLSQVLSNVVNLNGELPTPAYLNTDNQLVPAKNKGQRTDIILASADNATHTIVDAKYYDATNATGAPGWQDLVKQFFYAKALEFVYPNSRIKNAFIFPGSKAAYKTVHMQDRKSNNTLDSLYPPIHCFYIDPLIVLNSFNSDNKLKELTQQLLQPS
ncbi:LlaJI family restriction endonuclease [Rheinheimera sp. YQF-2]|uniref:LlaJI family restriction endonuclease n=1 Tax=Rheinheimera lutimaris TaxID=2740584 RepID=A0A7Y5ASQ7_9GAMM|nr:LlaJI family restriction endonuclease [Rheinheimera lutimaris]NRQ43609.1 LlaJI family restriction endonuclease [Rheinheimera lutimaris]